MVFYSNKKKSIHKIIHITKKKFYIYFKEAKQIKSNKKKYFSVKCATKKIVIFIKKKFFFFFRRMEMILTIND